MEKYLSVYLHEILIQKDYALISYDDFIESLDSDKDQRFCNYYIHHFLVHTSNIIKILFPLNNPKNSDNDFIQNRGRSVREALGLTESDFDISEIGIRNDLEHFDTRIDFWVKNSKNHNYADINIMPKGFIKDIDPKDMFRNIDPLTKVLSFCGKEFNLDYLHRFLQEKIKPLV